MKVDITQKELRNEVTILAFNEFDDTNEVELSFSKKIRKFGVFKNGELIKASKTFVPCMLEFKQQIKKENLDTIKKFD